MVYGINTTKEKDIEIKNVIGDNYPELFEKLQGGTLINVQVEEVVTKDYVVKYSYKQMFTTETNEEKLEKIKTQMLVEIYKEYLIETGWIWEKYNRNVLVLKDMTNEEFNLKYSDIISKQEKYRTLINELEVQLEVTNG